MTQNSKLTTHDFTASTEYAHKILVRDRITVSLTPSENHLHTDLEDSRVENRERTPPCRPELVVLRENGGLIERVVDVEGALNPHPGNPEIPDEPDVELVQPVFEHRHRRDDVGDGHVRDVVCEGAPEPKDLLVADHKARKLRYSR